MIFLISFISLLYLFLIGLFIIGFSKLPTFKLQYLSSEIKFSILIPFRNEASNLPVLLQSLNHLNYPKHLFEIILINDSSSDNYKNIIDDFINQNDTINIRLLDSDFKLNSSKKGALTTGIKQANFDWIITTDADCKAPKNWLQAYNVFIQKNNSVFIAAPVLFEKQNGFLFHFQQLNFLSLIGSTIGSFGINKPFMCNGANLCFKKEVFLKIGGYQDNFKIASGDDVFLLEKMLKKYPKKVHYLKSLSSLVLTKSESSWKEFYNQQLRWVSKATAYKNNFARYVGFMVFIENFILFLLFISTLFQPKLWILLIINFFTKILIDFILLFKTAHFFKKNISILNAILVSLFYPFFISFVALTSLFKKYEWKGRSLKK